MHTISSQHELTPSPYICTVQSSAADIAAGMLVKLKEECRLSQHAMKKVVDVTEFVCDHVVNEALATVCDIALHHGFGCRK